MIIGENIIRCEKVSSTNSEALKLAASNKYPEGSVVVADDQTAGRGRKGNIWEAAPGKNLTLSLILYPEFLLPEKQFLISKLCSLAIIDCLSDFTGNLAIKWPNDIYVKSDKIAGILIENIIMGNVYSSAVAGIGININQEKFIGDAPNPVSLKMVTGVDHNLESLLVELCEWLDHWYSLLKNGKTDVIDMVYHENLYGLGVPMNFRSSKKEFNGVIEGVDESGRLIVKKDDAVKKVYGIGEIEFILPARPNRQNFQSPI